MEVLLQQYYDTLAILNNLLDEETNRPLSLRDPLRIEVLCDEISDVVLAIHGMERRLDDKCGYRPRTVACEYA